MLNLLFYKKSPGKIEGGCWRWNQAEIKVGSKNREGRKHNGTKKRLGRNLKKVTKNQNSKLPKMIVSKIEKSIKQKKFLKV